LFRPWIVAVTLAVSTLATVPAVAQASVTSSSVTQWTSSEAGTPADARYLVSYDNPGHTTLLTVQGTAQGTGNVDIVCYYASGADAVFAANVSVNAGVFTTTAPLHPIAGHVCRLRAVPTGQDGAGNDVSSYAGPQVAISQAGLPSAFVDPTDQKYPYDFYVVGTTFSAYTGWNAAGSCGPYAAPVDSSFGVGNFAIDCMGSLLGDADLPVGQDRSEVQVDGQNAYDAASAQALFGGTEDLTGNDFPTLSAHAVSDPTDGLISSQSTEGWAVCASHTASYPPNATNCSTFASAGVQLERTITTSDGGLMITLTDTWSSLDGKAHSLDLLYDDYTGLKTSNAQRSYEFPGQPGFAAYQAPTILPAPGSAPGSILVHVNADGALPEAYGAVTFSQPASGFRFVSNNEFEEHQVLQVPAGGSASLSYVYSTATTAAQVQALALAAQDELEAPVVAVASPANGTTVSSPNVRLTGTAAAGSGITSLSIGGQSVALDPNGNWGADIPLQPGANTITAVATDRAGANAQTQLTVVYQPLTQQSSAPPLPAAPPVTCKVPRTKGMKLPAAERAVHLAHCQVGRIRHERSKKERKGRVLSSSPSVGRVYPSGHRIELFVSNGP
jgi:Glucodextranase, domain B